MRTSRISICFFAMIICSIAGSLYAQTRNNEDNYFEINKAIETFGSVFKALNSNYVDELNAGELTKTAIDAMLLKLDPYTNFYPESDMENVKLQLLGQYGGIGALVHYKNKQTIISEPYENLPAQKAGLMAGDVILKINGESCEGKTSDQVSEKLRGQAGTDLEISIDRNGKRIDKKLKREEIQLPNVSYSGMLSDKTGYIKLDEFTKNAAKNVLEA